MRDGMTDLKREIRVYSIMIYRYVNCLSDSPQYAYLLGTLDRWHCQYRPTKIVMPGWADVKRSGNMDVKGSMAPTGHSCQYVSLHPNGLCGNFKDYPSCAEDL